MKKSRILSILMIILFCTCFIGYVKSADGDILPDNGAKISSAQIIQTKTGTGPFDNDDSPGNDLSEDNNIVRSFDQVTWTIENTMKINNQEDKSYTGGKIYFEATLPEVLNSNNAKWDLESMIWIENPVVSSDGRTLTGYYQMSTKSTTIPGKQTLVFVLSILGASNGVEFQPTIKIWLNGNEEADKVTVVPEKIKISAAPKYNVKISQNSALQNKVTVDYGEGDTLGRMYGYGILIQLYNDNSSKGLKGIEYPNGDITFDIDMELYRTLFESTTMENITSECTPILWNYKVSDLSNDGVISGRSMYFGNNYNIYHRDMPIGVINNERRYSVYNSGNYAITQNGSKLAVKISDYALDGTFPIWNYGYGALGTSIVYPNNIGCFSVGYFQIFVPDNVASTMEDRNYYLKLTDSNFSATSNSGVETTTQMVTTDDSTNTQHVIYKKGYYSQSMIVFDKKRICQETRPGSGDAALSIGQEFNLGLKFITNITNDYDVYSATKFLKFDGDNFEPILNVNGKKYSKTLFDGNMEFNVWYVTKIDGTNWSSHEEMINANVEDMLVYENIEDIPEGAVCVGEYIESTEGNLARTSGENNLILIPLKVKDDANIGQTYGFVQRTKVWLDYLDRDVYTITNKDVEWPTPTWDFENRNYIKTEYDENGKIISGTHSGGSTYGNSVLIIAADLKVQKQSIDEQGNEKVNYDISKNEYDITYKITPSLNKISNVKVDIKNVTIKIKDILPKGFKYVTGSCEYGEPIIEDNSDGTTTLIWYVYNCEVGKEINPIYYKAHIDESTPNGTQYTNTVIVSADADKIGNIEESKRTATFTNQIINLASHRLYKTTESSVIELNETIKYTLTYKNNTDSIIPEFQLLDVLPYNGDSRGTSFNGSYKVQKIDITRYDINNNVIDTNDVSAYYTNDVEIRNNYSAKDDFINTVGTWNLIENQDNINQFATAIALKGTAIAQEKIVVDIYLIPENNKVEDIYCNTATAQTNSNTEEISSAIVRTQVIKRDLEGKVFIDNDNDAVISEGDTLLKDIEVSIIDRYNQQVKDVYGNIVSSIFTDENGYYKFENLPRGEYKVYFNIKDKNYMAVEKNKGTNVTINSKVNEDFGTDLITTLDNDISSKIIASDVNAGIVKKPAKVIINYKDLVTDSTLYAEVVQNGRIDDEYTTVNELDNINKENDNKYEFVKVEGQENGRMTEETINVTYYYQKKATSVITKYVDIDLNEEIYTQEKVDGRIDDEYTTVNELDNINKENDNKYEFVKVEGQENGKMTEEIINVTYYYQKKATSVITKYVDIDSNEEIYTQEKVDGRIDDEYTTVDRVKEINKEKTNKYVLVKTTENTEGKMTSETIEVIYYYKKVESQVITKYVNEQTGEEIADREYIVGYVGETYETFEKEIVGYELIEGKITGEKTGEFKEDVIEVIYYYKKIPNEVDTGDINVVGYVVISIVAVFGIFGIMYYLKKNKKLYNSK